MWSVRRPSVSISTHWPPPGHPPQLSWGCHPPSLLAFLLCVMTVPTRARTPVPPAEGPRPGRGRATHSEPLGSHWELWSGHQDADSSNGQDAVARRAWLSEATTGRRKPQHSRWVLATHPNPDAACPKQWALGVTQLFLPQLFFGGCSPSHRGNPDRAVRPSSQPRLRGGGDSGWEGGRGRTHLWNPA